MDKTIFRYFIKAAMELQSDVDTPYNYIMVKAAVEAKYGISKEAASPQWVHNMTTSGAQKASPSRLLKFIDRRNAAGEAAHNPYTPHSAHEIRSNAIASSAATDALKRKTATMMGGPSMGPPSPSRGQRFMHAAKAEVGPAGGAVIGAGLANAYGVSPLAGAAAGYGIGAIPEIIHGIRHRV